MPENVPEPCRTCGAPARERPRVIRERSITDTGPSEVVERVCTSSTCPTNGPRSERGIADVV